MSVILNRRIRELKVDRIRLERVIKSLLDCPDLNHDSLEDESVEAIQKAQKALGI